MEFAFLATCPLTRDIFRVEESGRKLSSKGYGCSCPQTASWCPKVPSSGKQKSIAKLNTHIYPYFPEELPSGTHKPWTLLCIAAAGHGWGGWIPSFFSGVSWEGNHLGGKRHLRPVTVCKSLFLIQWGKYTPLFWNKSQTQSSVIEHVLFPLPHFPPVTAAVSYLTKIAIQTSKGSSLYFFLWPSSAAASSAGPWGCSSIERGKIHPEVWYLKTARWESHSCLLCHWTLEKTGHRICFLSGKACSSLGKKAWPQRKCSLWGGIGRKSPGCIFFLKTEKYMVHEVHAAVPHLAFSPLFKADLYLFGNATF